MLDRRQFLAALGSTALASALPLPAGTADPAPLAAKDEALLDAMERAAFLFFWEQADGKTGLVKDRAKAGGNDDHSVASTAATGFGLTALAIGHQRGYADKLKIEKRVEITLRFLAEHLEHQHGFFFHFLDVHSAQRVWQSEVSSIDTSLLLCGVLTCRAYFTDPVIRKLATAIYERVDWTWMLNGGPTLSMGWKPESGFLDARWEHYCELMMIYLLAMASPTHPIPITCWQAWRRPWMEYKGIRYISANDPLFVHQYSHAWYDFRGLSDGHANYFDNSVKATAAHRLFCQDLAKKFPDYGESLWGISASDSAKGYVVWGGPPAKGSIDGSIVPCATAGSLPFLPQQTLQVLQTIRSQYGYAWKRYGFVDAFNPLTNWYDEDVIGIDQGISMLMAENLRSGFVWKTFMGNPEAKIGMQRAGFKPA